ncbi:MAG: hypothetical protein HN730_08125, partial [Bdellovibrionales bacterium]|nr:hypothetical protein [Bdellovibrionales bacterium]
LLLFTGVTSAKESKLRPYILASNNQEAGLEQMVKATQKSLLQGGFRLAGEYSPYPDTHITVITNQHLILTAEKSQFGGYGAAIRVAHTKIDGKIQLSYVNPLYMAQVYRMSEDLSTIHQKLKELLGNIREFGSEDGITAKGLREYHYMTFMPYFDDHNELAKYDSYQAAVKAVMQGLAAEKGKVVQVYRINLPSKKETLFGVGIIDKGEDGSDQTVMKTCDKSPLKHSAHLPYDLLISGNKVYALHGKFRIAQSFPDLSMGTFMKIVGAPGSIEDILTRVAQKR